MLGARNGFQDLVLFEATMDQIFSRAVDRWPDRIFIVADGVSLTYREMNALVDQVAQSLLALGVAPGDRVAVWMSNIWEWVAVQFAVTRVGAVLAPLNTRLRVEDLRHTLKDSGARVLLTQAASQEFSYVEVIREIVQDPASVPDLRHVVVARPTGPLAAPFIGWDAFLTRGGTQRRTPQPATDPNEMAYILYTSGTTSRPKGVMLSHANLNNSLRMAHDYLDGDSTFLIYPMFAITGCHNAMLPTLMVGGSIVMQERFDPAEALDLIEKHRCAVIGCIIYILDEMVNAPGFSPERVSSLRLANVFPRRPHHRELLAKFNIKVAATGYGMTETCGPVVFAVDLDPNSMTSEGVAWDGVAVRTILPDGTDAAPGQEGAIIVKGRQVMLGYFNLPEATAKAIDKNGWLHTGDVGFFDEKKRLTWLGRYTDMYKCSGFNVASQEVEAFLGRHPDVAEVAVLGVPDAGKGEVGAAFIVAKPGAVIDKAEIGKFCSGRIASYKIPGHVFVREHLPKTASGKVRKVELKAFFTEQAARG
ncbi:MAG: acyl-CoA synthetase (AMP-forming)/AMP-acid ligase [Alphaproteobacteria bacterium]|nr:acyl-CoA synthetase (AMP-forming)/AMP-acid ligase [Alphaproteobacteria bacterium]